MDENTVAGSRLLDLATPYLARRDRDGLAIALREAWSVPCLVLLLDQSDPVVVATAAICVGLIGHADSLPRLATLLHHADEQVVEAAEEAMWTISFRAGTPLEHQALWRIAESIRAGVSENVATLLKPLIRANRRFAEAFHQRGQAHYLDGAFSHALRDADRTIAINPYHFAAHALRANCLAAMHREKEALEAYRRVLQIHPRFYGARDAIHCLQRHLAGNAG